MRVRALIFVIALGLVGAGLRAGAQETQAEPLPTEPAGQTTNVQPAGSQTNGSQPPAAQQTPAPIERRATKPSTSSAEPVAGPLTGAGTPAQRGSQPVNQGGPVGTIRVETRLVNVALNVVDAHGAPVGGFEKQDFQLFEDGKLRPIAVFERESASPLSIVLAIDASETVLTSERLEREAAKRFVRGILREQDELDLMEFADTVQEIVPFTNQAKRVETGLGEIQRGDATALYDAIFLASEQLAKTKADAGRRRVIVLITDGGDTAKHSQYTQALEQAERAGAMIYSIIVVPIAADAGRNVGGEHALIQMSEDTGGKYYYVEDPKDLEPAFKHVSDDLRTQYLLGYYAPQGAGGDFRRIKVKMTDAALGEKYSLRYRTGYFADGK
jgi:Ca-activated chloride channel family protein